MSPSPASGARQAAARTAVPVALVLLALLPGAGFLSEARAARLRVEAGRFDRTNTPVSVAWSGPETAGELRADDGVRAAFEVVDGRLWYVEPGLARGAGRTYEVHAGAATASPCAAVKVGTAVDLRLRGRTVLRYHAGPSPLPRPDIPPEFHRGGYLHPVFTPSGRAVTDDYPPNHVHQHGLWWSWTRTSFEGREPDFWNMGQRKGRTDFDGLDAVAAGPVMARFTGRQRYTDLLVQPPRTALLETWTVRLYAGSGDAPAFHLFDLESEQQCATASPLRLPKYHYGGFAFRGLWGWNGPTQVLYLDSLGATNRVAANATRPRWFWMGGPPESPGPDGPSVVGLALLGHPGNFRAPQPLRVHPTEPYAAWSPSQLGDWEITPGQPYRSTYRMVVFDGAPDPVRLEALWNDFAEPPAARVP